MIFDRLEQPAPTTGKMVEMTNGGLAEQLEQIESGRRRLREAVERLGGTDMGVTTSAGWTVKEMVAHVAFWEETVDPVVNGMYRGNEVPVEAWYRGDDLALAPGEPWPIADVHNAREAAWARSRPAEEVLARWDRAHERLLAVVRTITEAEARQNEYFGGKISAATYDHYAKHLVELEGGDTP